MYERVLTAGKSAQYGRSHGFFIRVRGRVINLEDELFGLDALNHAAWTRFMMELDADGLRDHLLSSREGVRESSAVFDLREYLHLKFNECRAHFERTAKYELVGMDIGQLLSEAPPSVIVEPFAAAVRSELTEPGRQLYYIDAPRELAEEDVEEWLGEYEQAVSEQPFAALDVKARDPYDRLVSYDTATRELRVNDAHPFISKIAANSKNQTPAALVASAEVMTDALLREVGVDSRTAVAFFERRDRTLRMLAGDYGPDAREVLRRLDVAHQDKTALERAIGFAFQVIGFSYEARGGHGGGCDGVLGARLGKIGSAVADYRVVYDAKQTDRTAVPAAKVDITAVQGFATDEEANFGLVVAKAFDAQDDPNGALNQRLATQSSGGEDDAPAPVSALLLEDLKRLVQLHYVHGVPLTRVRSFFETGFTVPDGRTWVDELSAELAAVDSRVPLNLLLVGLEAAKSDLLSPPNVNAVRATSPELKKFDPDRLIAALGAVETIVGSNWIEVDRQSGHVKLHHSAEQIATEVDRRIREDLGLAQFAADND